jgi:hypothetical protein
MRRGPAKSAVVIALLAVSLLVALSALLFACGSASGTAGTQDDQPLMRTLDGKAVSLEDYRGKPVFLAFMEST